MLLYSTILTASSQGAAVLPTALRGLTLHHSTLHRPVSKHHGPHTDMTALRDLRLNLRRLIEFL